MAFELPKEVMSLLSSRIQSAAGGVFRVTDEREPVDLLKR